MAELRKDPTTRRWVIVASGRGKRPSDFRGKARRATKKDCPFEPGAPEVKKAAVYLHWEHPAKYSVAVVPNKYPALSYEGLPRMVVKGLYTTIDAVGGHEIFVDTPRHTATWATMTVDEFEALLYAYRERYKFWFKDERVKYVLIFKNWGLGSGASLVHPHSQLAATPVVPPRTLEELEKGERHFKAKRTCIYCDLLKDEKRLKRRIVHESESFIVMCPFASRFPFELQIFPKRHSSNFVDSRLDEIKDLAETMHAVFGRVKRILGDPPYNALIHVAPQYAPNLRFYHWHIEIIPRLTEVAGFEWGAGVYINPTPPEQAAVVLRGF